MLNYVWQHLVDTEPRGQITYEFLKKHIKPDYEYVLDGLCGFAPMRAYFDNHKYYGFDINEYAIDTVSKKYKNSFWQVCDDLSYIYPAERIDVFLSFGISAGEKKTDSKTETNTSIKIIEKFSPKLVVLETCTGHYDNIKNAGKTHHFDELAEYCGKKYKTTGNYKFDAKLNRPEVSNRMMLVYEQR